MNHVSTPPSSTPSPFHSGEQALQELIGKREVMESVGKRAIRSYMPEQHREFFAQLPFMVIGSVDENGWPWASILPGKPGFIESLDSKTLTLNAPPLKGDPLATSLLKGAPLGLLGIEINTRRRNRLNAHIQKIDNDKITLGVDQSFGNCPQYIQRRSVNFIREPGDTEGIGKVQTLDALDDLAMDMIRAADTFFVSSYVNTDDQPFSNGVDVSHRGGKPGFVKVEGNTLTVPDYPGNNFFNTLGNFLINPKAGLAFLDFETGDVLQLTGTIELIDADDQNIKAFDSAERGWRFTLNQGVRLNAALPFRSVLQDFSPNSLLAGDWAQADAVLSAAKQSNIWKPYSVVRIKDESSEIRSFYLEPTDDRFVPPFEAGQFLTLRVKPSDSEPAVNRTYTVSSAPNENHYRISVKRESKGRVTKYLHDHLNVGDQIEAKAPVGDFFLDATKDRPAVLIAGGVGITPMLSMVEHVANESLRTRHRRSLTVLHAAQSTQKRAFSDRLQQLQKHSEGALSYYSIISQPEPHEKAGVEFNGAGRISADIIKQILALDDYDFYLCGPSGFMQTAYDSLQALGVRDVRISAESFGPSSLNRSTDEDNIETVPVQEAESAVINFSHSNFEQQWNAGDDTLLEVAEKHGLTPAYGCRSGSCGSCATKLLSGSITYRTKITASHEDDEILICCAVPALGSDTLELEL